MALARIYTRFPKEAEPLAESLRAEGYKVEIVPPGTVCRRQAEIEYALDLDEQAQAESAAPPPATPLTPAASEIASPKKPPQRAEVSAAESTQRAAQPKSVEPVNPAAKLGNDLPRQKEEEARREFIWADAWAGLCQSVGEAWQQARSAVTDALSDIAARGQQAESAARSWGAYLAPLVAWLRVRGVQLRQAAAVWQQKSALQTARWREQFGERSVELRRWFTAFSGRASESAATLMERAERLRRETETKLQEAEVRRRQARAQREAERLRLEEEQRRLREQRLTPAPPPQPEYRFTGIAMPPLPSQEPIPPCLDQNDALLPSGVALRGELKKDEQPAPAEVASPTSEAAPLAGDAPEMLPPADPEPMRQPDPGHQPAMLEPVLTASAAPLSQASTQQLAPQRSDDQPPASTWQVTPVPPPAAPTRAQQFRVAFASAALTAFVLILGFFIVGGPTDSAATLPEEPAAVAQEAPAGVELAPLEAVEPQAQTEPSGVTIAPGKGATIRPARRAVAPSIRYMDEEPDVVIRHHRRPPTRGEEARNGVRRISDLD